MESTSVDGVAMSVVGLYPLCLQGYTMVQGLFDAPQAVKPALAMLFVQSGVSNFLKFFLIQFLNSSRLFLVGHFLTL
jgi:hypothetical protein